jgi:GH24 family phage-related lysozyme (muramidase)
MDGRELTKGHEGYVEGIYLDSLGYPTCGYGHCLDWTKSYKTVKAYHEDKFREHYAQAEQDYLRLELDLDPVRAAAVKDLLFNLGYGKFIQFHATIRALRMKDYRQAAHQLEQSRWYKQVGRRGPRICKLIETGDWGAI